MRKYFMLVLLISIFLLSGCKPIKKISDTTTKKVTTIGTTTLPHTNKAVSCAATYAKYWSITNGMSYSAVTSIIGCEGILQTDSNNNGVHRQSYYWYGETAEQILAVSFTNGLSDGASQYNLDKGIDTSNYTRTTINIETSDGEIETKGETIYEATYDPVTKQYYDKDGNVVDIETDPRFTTTKAAKTTKKTAKTIYEPSWDPVAGKYIDPYTGAYIDR